MLDIDDAKEYCMMIFKRCAGVVDAHLIELKNYFRYAVEVTFADMHKGQLMSIHDGFPDILNIMYSPGDGLDERSLWMYVLDDHLWRTREPYSCVPRHDAVGILKQIGVDDFRFIRIPTGFKSRSLDELKVELDLMGA